MLLRAYHAEEIMMVRMLAPGHDENMAEKQISSRFGYTVDELSRILADDILLGNVAPGTHLSEAMLVDKFSVSRTPRAGGATADCRSGTC